MTPFFFSEKNLPNPKRSGVSPAVLFLIILQYVSWMTNLKLHQVCGRKMAFPIFFSRRVNAGWKRMKSGVWRQRYPVFLLKLPLEKKTCSPKNNMFFSVSTPQQVQRPLLCPLVGSGILYMDHPLKTFFVWSWTFRVPFYFVANRFPRVKTQIENHLIIWSFHFLKGIVLENTKTKPLGRPNQGVWKSYP